MRFFLGLGSNLGDRGGSLRAAHSELEQRGIHIVASSSTYETDPVGGPPGAQNFFNQVVEVETDLHLGPLLVAAHAIESKLGRNRNNEVRWGPRLIDIDILCGDESVNENGFVVPHPRLGRRGFVVIPLAEIAPYLVIEGLGPVSELLERVGSEGVRIIP